MLPREDAPAPGLSRSPAPLHAGFLRAAVVQGSLELTAQCALCRQRPKPALRSPQTPSSHTCSGSVTAGRGLCHLTECKALQARATASSGH